MDNLLREIKIENGLVVRFFDNSRRYYGDFHQVRIDIRCSVPILADNFDDSSIYAEARALFGETLLHVRKVEQMGIPGSEVSTAINSIIVNFIEHSLPYFSVPFFPVKLVAAEMGKHKKRLTFPAANGINLHG